MSARDEALAAVKERGWFVFRLHIGHDKAKCSGGESNCKTVDTLGSLWGVTSSDDPDVVQGWDWSQANAYGIDCGKSGLVVVDQDPGGSWPYGGTRVHSTGRGRHYVYEDVLGLPNATHKQPWNVDVRGTGGMIIGPGSWHPHGEYAVVEDADVLPAPPELVNAMTVQPAGPVVVYDGPVYADLTPAQQREANKSNEALVEHWRTRFEAALDWAEGEHDEKGRGWERLTVDASWAFAKRAAVGWSGWDEAKAGEVYRKTLPDAIAADPKCKKWYRGIVAKATKGDLEERPEAAEDLFEPLVEGLFDSTPTLSHIRQAAHAQMISAPALLCYVLVRILAELPPQVRLPAAVGGEASLNLGIAVVGGSGAGKTALMSVSRTLLGFTGRDQTSLERNLGSGEGIAQSFLKWNTVTKCNELIDDPRRIFVVDEVDSLGATKGRSGATLAPTLRSALTGSALGQENATADRNRNLRANTYRLVLMVGVQPTRSGALLEDADAGTPQRLVWVKAKEALDDDVEWPGELEWQLPSVPDLIPYPDHVRKEIRAARMAYMRDGADELEGHRLLTRLKVATALGLLHQQAKITDQWWGLAGQIIEQSMQVQNECKAVLRSEKQRDLDATAIVRDRAEDAVDEDKVKRAARAIRNKVRDAGGEWIVWDQVRPSQRLREYADEARERLIRAGEIEVEEYTSSRGNESRRLRWV